jgi:hypothetical protein
MFFAFEGPEVVSPLSVFASFSLNISQSGTHLPSRFGGVGFE